MAACLLIGATRVYARDSFNVELDELEFPAARAIEWLNEHTAEVLQTTELYVFLRVLRVFRQLTMF